MSYPFHGGPDVWSYKCNRCAKPGKLNAHGFCKECWSLRTDVEPKRCPRCLNKRYVLNHFDVHCVCGYRQDLLEAAE